MKNVKENSRAARINTELKGLKNHVMKSILLPWHTYVKGKKKGYRLEVMSYFSGQPQKQT